MNNGKRKLSGESFTLQHDLTDLPSSRSFSCPRLSPAPACRGVSPTGTKSCSSTEGQHFVDCCSADEQHCTLDRGRVATQTIAALNICAALKDAYIFQSRDGPFGTSY